MSRTVKKNMYLLPNLLTTLALFSGFFAIISAFNAQYITAVHAVIAAMLFDGIDGRVARMTGSESLFGKEFDSLSDMVSFGVSPALIAYTWSYQQFGKLGWAVSFLYVAATAMRLAKFNSQAQSSHFFQGLPSPAAAACMIALVWTVEYYHLNHFLMGYVALLFGLFTGILMISNIPYYSFKSLTTIHKLTPNVAIGILLVLFFIACMPVITFSLSFILYALSGAIYALPGVQGQLVRLKDKIGCCRGK